MSMTDPIADFLTRVRNGARASHDIVSIPSSKLKRELARILKEQGYIDGYTFEPASPEQPAELIKIRLKYTGNRRPVIQGIQRVSRPGQRTYVGHSDIPKIQGGLGTAIISTSQGVMTGHEARSKGVGGEVVAKVW
ncbi:30S ribosomal protein S8 [Conexibacter sp. CPCC 206217]|uniref:30S ribosomal protein S8 n=1 Tax=Conexibacter sp. CPCC 206217 TaxID=3064574 RepID=UPI00271C1C28|nr:30S ribosomal protein S8 [Conexibacter sp. CPCC 206217]MDO8209704.1 30S ribosomal protein S8 [Conexibacter sp. CPCC 206217]